MAGNPMPLELEKLLFEIKRSRKELLDLFEAAIGDSPRWMAIRSKILATFGRDGLEGAVREVIARNGAEDHERFRN